MSAPVWLITGVSNGLGRALGLRVLKAGHNVIGTVRSRTKAAEAVNEIESLKGKIIEIDLREPQSSIHQKLKAAESIFGRIDVLVNNAGFSVLGPIEGFTEKEAVNQMQTNFFGPLYAMQAVLPGMRARQSGTIVNVSSVGGMDALPTSGLYASSKFALEGLSESLAREVGEFGVSILIVEPGAFRTKFLNAMEPSDGRMSETYHGDTEVGRVMKKFEEMTGKQPGDPDKAVDRIFEVVAGEGPAGHLKGKLLRLPLGDDALQRIKTKVERVEKDLEASWDLASNLGFDSN
ncbi:Oxidoreductase yusz [Pleurostoma richardsiae]|uniref:Oxidoreductase yusz n=1 Tax=Pleurostoma richardsiae TaxID=41990 RepID=A0AA38S827_9PEZI|nr:Oxidoreductase yusz [Pleurostoma richardsiae]